VRLAETETRAGDDPRFVNIAVQGSALSADFALSDSPALPTAGWDGWAEQVRGRRRSMLVFQGPGAWAIDLPVAIDAYGEDRPKRIAIVRRHFQVLRALTALPHPGAAPPLATLTGKTLYATDDNDATSDWALRAVTATQPALHDSDTGEIVQWIGTLSFSQVVTQAPLRITQGPAAGMRIHVVKEGETLASIARSEHVPISKITRSNGTRIRDPQTVKPKDALRLPPRGSS
jgi:LysM repeat protein